jgi:hypothetical protein
MDAAAAGNIRLPDAGKWQIAWKERMGHDVNR